MLRFLIVLALALVVSGCQTVGSVQSYIYPSDSSGGGWGAHTIVLVESGRTNETIVHPFATEKACWDAVVEAAEWEKKHGRRVFYAGCEALGKGI